MNAPSPRPWAVILPHAVVAVTGPDTTKFLQGLISNDAGKAGPSALLYAFLLTPQGKYLFDFHLHPMAGGLAFDVDFESATALSENLLKYRLRSKVQIDVRADLCVAALENGGALGVGLPDPRFAGLGRRLILPRDGAAAALAEMGYDLRYEAFYDAHRLALGVPDHHDFTREQSFLLECNGEELHGVDFRKGCYVGQELTARMKHRGTARRRIFRVGGGGLSRGATVLDNEREIGAVLSARDGQGLATIRLDRWREALGRPLTAGGSPVQVLLPVYDLHLPAEDAKS
jgi:tRNA-modifying protein YgfZ